MLQHLHIAYRQKSISSVVQHVADRAGNSYTFAVEDILGEQQSRQRWQPALCLPSKSFCHTLNEVNQRPENPPTKSGLKLLSQFDCRAYPLARPSRQKKPAAFCPLFVLPYDLFLTLLSVRSLKLLYSNQRNKTIKSNNNFF